MVFVCLRVQLVFLVCLLSMIGESQELQVADEFGSSVTHIREERERKALH